MKKTLLIGVVLLLLIVLASPGIVGRLAENAMGNSIHRAAGSGQDLRVSTEQYERSWFSSEGEHRIEIRGAQALPAIIVHTRIDHGFIPLTSLTREHGSLAPGLGHAVSTLTLQQADGELQDIPGTIYSKLGFTGALHSSYRLEPGSSAFGDTSASWGPVEIVFALNQLNKYGLVTGDVAVDTGAVSFTARHPDAGPFRQRSRTAAAARAGI